MYLPGEVLRLFQHRNYGHNKKGNTSNPFRRWLRTGGFGIRQDGDRRLPTKEEQKHLFLDALGVPRNSKRRTKNRGIYHRVLNYLHLYLLFTHYKCGFILCYSHYSVLLQVNRKPTYVNSRSHVSRPCTSAEGFFEGTSGVLPRGFSSL